MKLYFDNGKSRREIGQPNTEQEAYFIIQKFLDDHNYKSYYVRTWTTPDGEKWFDVGSYTEFFVLDNLVEAF